jgi:hypothetical protein
MTEIIQSSSPAKGGGYHKADAMHITPEGPALQATRGTRQLNGYLRLETED